MYSQWQGNNNRSDPPRAEVEKYWKDIWEREASHNTDAQWLVDLRADHSNIPEQEPVTISMADEPAAEGWDPTRMANPGQDSPNHEGPPEGTHPVQLPANYLSLHNMEGPVSYHCSKNE